MCTEPQDLWDSHLSHVGKVSQGSALFLPGESLTNMSTRDRLIGFTPSLSKMGIPSAHLMIEDKHLFCPEALFHPAFHVLYIGSGDDGGVFEVLIGKGELLRHNFEPMCVQRELRLCTADVRNVYVFPSILHIGLCSAGDMIDRDIERVRFLSWLAFVETKSLQIADPTIDLHDG